MTRDKQLIHVGLDQVLEKRHLDQALNAKQFAVLAGISYSAARTWFRQPGFPAFCGVVFWQDFVRWRNVKIGLPNTSEPVPRNAESPYLVAAKPLTRFTGRAARVLAEAGQQKL
jgi:hypothetical protein